MPANTPGMRALGTNQGDDFWWKVFQECLKEAEAQFLLSYARSPGGSTSGSPSALRTTRASWSIVDALNEASEAVLRSSVQGRNKGGFLFYPCIAKTHYHLRYIFSIRLRSVSERLERWRYRWLKRQHFRPGAM